MLERLLPAVEPCAVASGHEDERPLPPVRTLAMMGLVLGSVGGGALLGAALAALFTPMSGRELRRKLSGLLVRTGRDREARDRDEPRADYDSGEFVIAEVEAAEHPHRGGDAGNDAQDDAAASGLDEVGFDLPLQRSS